jgi:hypothetical protein
MSSPRWEIEGNLLEGAAAGRWSHQVNVVADNSAFRCVRCQYTEKVATCSNCSGPWFTGDYGSDGAVGLVCMNCHLDQTRWTCPKCGTDNSIRNSFGKLKSGPCFIATAAYGSALAPDVILLGHFRDDVLLRSTLGSILVDLYYSLSPPLASIVAHHDYLRRGVRVILIRPILQLVKIWTRHEAAQSSENPTQSDEGL